MTGAHKHVDDRVQGLTGGRRNWPGRGKVVWLEVVERLHNDGGGGMSAFEQGQEHSMKCGEMSGISGAFIGVLRASERGGQRRGQK
jgi:hypothetical protein